MLLLCVALMSAIVIQHAGQCLYSSQHGRLQLGEGRATGICSGSGTLCAFHTYVGADDMWVFAGRRG